MQDHKDTRSGNDDRAEEYLDQSIRVLATRALSDDDPLTRKHAIYLLSLTQNPEDIDIFTKALKDPEKEVRSQATRALAHMGEPALKELLSLLKDPDWRVRYRAAEALGLMKIREAGIPLIECLSDDNDHVRYMAVKALGQLGDDEILEAVKPCLQDNNPYVRGIAASILGQ